MELTIKKDITFSLSADDNGVFIYVDDDGFGEEAEVSLEKIEFSLQCHDFHHEEDIEYHKKTIQNIKDFAKQLNNLADKYDVK